LDAVMARFAWNYLKIIYLNHTLGSTSPNQAYLQLGKSK